MTKQVQALVALAAAVVILVCAVWLAKQHADYNREKAVFKSDCKSWLETLDTAVGKAESDIDRAMDLAEALRGGAEELDRKYVGTKWASYDSIMSDIKGLSGLVASNFQYLSIKQVGQRMGVKPPPLEPGAMSDEEQDKYIREKLEKLRAKVDKL